MKTSVQLRLGRSFTKPADSFSVIKRCPLPTWRVRGNSKPNSARKSFRSSSYFVRSPSFWQLGSSSLISKPTVSTKAVEAPPEAGAHVVFSQAFDVPNGNAVISVTVTEQSDGSQIIDVASSLQAGRLLLHWGVEGGPDYQGGWRLPLQCMPAGTNVYKDRALQSPFRQEGEGYHIIVRLTPNEASDVVNFVLKDDATNTWYDNNGANFRVPLRSNSATDGALETVLPSALCDKWSWLRWDFKKRPSQSRADAAEDYAAGVKEMKELLAKGRSLEELWKVAEGSWKYADYQEKVVKPTLGDTFGQSIAKSKERPPQGPIPQDLLSVQAYVCWEKAGKPDGADFAGEAERVIQEKLKQGATYESMAAELKFTPKWTTPGNIGAAQPDQPKSQPSPEQPKAAAPPEVGKPLETPKRNPLDMIKPSGAAPVLSAEKGQRREMPLDFLEQRFAIDSSTKWRRKYNLGNKSEMLVVVRQEHDDAPVRVDFFTDRESKLVLHWGVSEPGSRAWKLPPVETRPEGSVESGATACETDFLNCEDDECEVEYLGAKVPLQRSVIQLPAGTWIGAISAVMRSRDGTMWYKDSGSDFLIPVPCKHAAPDQVSPDIPDDLSRAIVDAEDSSQWTLMHRFHKASDLLEDVINGKYELDAADAFSRIYTWLRYSATRKLTWQRNYNTQPRILSGAQDRLTKTISDIYTRTAGEPQEWVRMMLTTVGRGGDGQRIRDEILDIMHKNNIPEKRGTWMEDWHQKLHNNTTPDDVAICEAFLAFMESNGDMGAYWRVLSDAGITRQRLESYDRAIKTEPSFDAGRKDALIRDFRRYLGTLKNVHSGADLQASAAAAGNRIPDKARGYLGYVMSNLGDSQTLPLMEAAVEARTELGPAIGGNRELMYLDLALEDQARQAAERGVSAAGFGAAAYMKPLLQNLCLSVGNNEELCYCLKAWQELPSSVRNARRPSKEEALLGVAVINRIRRAISDVSDNVVNRIGDISKIYGKAFHVEPWAYELFGEEVVRGGPAFAVSLVISNVEPHLRSIAELGAWQVISPNEAIGVVEIVDGLYEVQDKTYSKPTVLLAQQVTGEEEIPEGVVAVVTPDAPDVLSHVSVRARNMRVLFATCHSVEPLEQIQAEVGQMLHFTTTASGSVNWTRASEEEVAAASDSSEQKPTHGLTISVPEWCGKWAIGMDEYRQGVVGAKSRNIAQLRGKLPEWIALPASVTLPFGCYEEALKSSENREILEQLQKLVKMVNERPSSSSSSSDSDSREGGPGPAALLEDCRRLAMQIKVPEALREQLTECMAAAGVPAPDSEERWAKATEAIKGVWASKYNDRAYFSLRKIGLSFDDVRMAVLVQRVVPAHYAFVIHTRNPSTNDPNEIFCELVRGLGESLVSGMVAGSAVAFKANKKELDKPEIVCYASKSEGMFVPESLIFRSDSNGEDLEGYAGAGLYESLTMDETEIRRVDYMDDRIVQDAAFRQQIFSRICKVGAAIEETLGSAQDIEGVVEENEQITVVQTRPQM